MKALLRTTAAVLIILAAVVIVDLLYRWTAPEGFDQRIEFARGVAQIVIATTVLVGLWFTQKTVRNSQHTLDHSRRTEAASMYARAVDQLGEESEAVQLGALYTLQSLFSNRVFDREASFNTVQRFVASADAADANNWMGPASGLAKDGLAIIADMAEQQSRSGSGGFLIPRQTSRYEGSNFNAAELTSGLFTNAYFHHSLFVNTRFIDVDFEKVSFYSSRLDSTMFPLCTFRDVQFNQAYLNNTMFSVPYTDDAETTSRLFELFEMGVSAMSKAKAHIYPEGKDYDPTRLAARFEGTVEMGTAALELTHFEHCDLSNVQRLKWINLDKACLSQYTKLPDYLAEQACVWRTRTDSRVDAWQYREVEPDRTSSP